MKATNAQMSQQLSVKIEDGRLEISIGIALLAFAVQSQDMWPEEFHVSDIRDFANSMARQLLVEGEDGTTLVHIMLDRAAQELLEEGSEGVDQGDVEAGLDLAKSILDRKDGEDAHDER